MIQLPPDFKEFLSLLNSTEVEYLLIGSYAVNCYTYPRVTGDMDVWVAKSAANLQRLAEALRRFGFAEISAEVLFRGHDMLRIGVPPLRLEILTVISGVTFEDCYVRRLSVEIEGVPVNVISRSDLRANKAAAGRPKDLADLAALDD